MSTAHEIWTFTLVIFAVVLVAVAVLLALILREARRIREGVAEIWTVGQKIANNTIHVGLLFQTHRIAGQILESARGVVSATGAVSAHAGRCPGCPECVAGRGGAR